MTIRLTFVTENSSRGFGDWLIGKTVWEEDALRAFYDGPQPVSLDEISDLLTAAIIADVIISIEP